MRCKGVSITLAATAQLNPCDRALLEELKIVQIVKKLPTY
jgi:hypothetical protein